MNTTSFQHSRKKVNRAGDTLLDPSSPEQSEAKDILDSWRACHVSPLNRFQTSLKRKLKKIDLTALISQRLKRTPSIIHKLERHLKMKLSRMQDIGGIRAVVKDMATVRALESTYKKGTKVFSVATGGKDYIIYPKTSGYRSVHHIFKCKNGFSIELQIRTKIQHAWATAVETVGTFKHSSLKSGEGPKEWLDFFALASSAFAILESTPRIPKYDHLTDQETFEALLRQEKKLDAKKRLTGYRIAVKHIKDDKKEGEYYLIILDFKNRSVEINSYSSEDIDQANIHYSDVEKRISRYGEKLQVVLVTSESIKALKEAYPSYFLDAKLFSKQIDNVAKQLEKLKKPAKL